MAISHSKSVQDASFLGGFNQFLLERLNREFGNRKRHNAW